MKKLDDRRVLITPPMSATDESARDSGKRKQEHRRIAIVRCRDFRCLAYLGKDGKWRDERGNVLDVCGNRERVAVNGERSFHFSFRAFLI